jgi:Rieske Fe-S protein
LQSVGGSVKFPWKDELPIIVRQNTPGSYEAFSSTCTHAGCEVDLPSGGVIQCPCHGATYTVDGIRQSGPAKRNLFQATSVSLAGNTLSITFG